MDAPSPAPAVATEPAWLSRQRWQRRLALWTGALAVAMAAIVFARGADYASALFARVVGYSRWWPLAITPIGFAILAWLTEGTLRASAAAASRR